MATGTANGGLNGNAAKLLVVSSSQELVDRFVQNVCSPVLERDGCVVLGGKRVAIIALAGDPDEVSDWKESLLSADAAMLLVEHVDAFSVNALAKVYNTFSELPSSVPVAFFIVREANSKEFKVSCLKCGQKIMLRDEYVGRSCTCPNCKKPIMIVSQKMALRQQLGLPMESEVEQLDGVNRDMTRDALERLMDRAATLQSAAPIVNQDALKLTTMRINLPDLL